MVACSEATLSLTSESDTIKNEDACMSKKLRDVWKKCQKRSEKICLEKKNVTKKTCLIKTCS